MIPVGKLREAVVHFIRGEKVHQSSSLESFSLVKPQKWYNKTFSVKRTSLVQVCSKGGMCSLLPLVADGGNTPITVWTHQLLLQCVFSSLWPQGTVMSQLRLDASDEAKKMLNLKTYLADLHKGGIYALLKLFKQYISILANIRYYETLYTH